MILPGSYANGFAPRDGSPAFPSLWRDCIGAWAPCLGPTGLTLRDWSVRKDHGTLVNATFKPRSLLFNGTSAYVSFASGIGSRTGSSACSLSLWMNATSVSSRQALVADWDSSGSAESFAAQVGWSSGQAGIAVRSPSVAQVSAGTVAANVWTHLCFISGASGTQVYVNGTRTFSSATAVTLDSGNTLSFGRAGALSSFYFGGEMDDVRLYRRVLSQAEINMLRMRRGIAYELAPRRRSSVAVAAFNRRRRLLLGASS